MDGNMLSLAICSWILICAVSSSPAVEELDTREGSDVTLKCRFPPTQSSEPLTYYWVRTTSTTTTTHDNVAIGDIPLQFNYQIQYKPRDGIYDLIISNATYDGENGRFECRIKAGGSGRVVHSQQYSLVVLIPPRAPVLTPGPHAQAQEDNELQLACATTGGSPPPTVKWYREGSPYPLEANVTTNKQRPEQTIATLSVMPTKDEDGAVYRCVVWNRAMPEGEQLESSLDLSVSYFPRVKVGPENPLRVEINEDAPLECKVDAKPKANNVRWTRNGKFVSSSLTHVIRKVTVEDAGKYTCTADNGLDHPGEAEIYLDVLYPPSVTVRSTTYETEEGGTVEIRCDVSSNPEPVTVEWSMEGKPDFRQKSDTLLLTNVKAEMQGTYNCRAVNVISTSSGKRTERSGTASVIVLIRHKPGHAQITPTKPIVQEGSSITLTCSAQPPGWPAPQYRWFRDIVSFDAEQQAIATGNKYTIPSAHLGSEGAYYCQATNELGHGDMVSVNLEVHQPPRFQTKLQPHVNKGTEETDFAVTCSAVGKPRPSVIWMKDNVEIKTDSNLYEMKNDISEGTNSNYNVQSTLKFNGNGRTNTNRLIPEDRGFYSCIFENEVKKVESTMRLRIEHEPIAIRQKHKVAYDLSETAELSCRVLAFPKPDFQWFFGSNNIPLDSSTGGHYEVVTSTDGNDSYLSALRIRNMKSHDYGDYYCKVKNTLGSIKPQIRLQPKGAPDSPKTLTAMKIGPSFVTLNWDAGFDGGLSNTKYFISYKRLGRGSGSNGAGLQCSSEKMYDSEVMEYDCGKANPCNVTQLEQNDSYLFKVKAVNTKGQSNYSNELTVTTKVDIIPAPEQVTFEPSTRTVAFSVGPTCLALVGIAESLTTGRNQGAAWQVADTVTLTLSGTSATFQEGQIDFPQALTKPSRNSGRSFADPVADEFNPRLRLKLCLRVSPEICSDYTEAEIGPSYIKEASAVTTATVVAIVVSGLVFIVFLSLLFVFCRCKKNVANKDGAKDYEMDAMRPAMVSPQNQAPPPYYPSTGMENKALEHSMDLALSMEDSKSAVYGTQSGYGYHVPAQPHPGQNMSNADWVNMGYMDNNYANSNNGGSVNSQDSLWQMKMAANSGVPIPHQMMDRQSNYGYDPMSHGGYGTIDDYAPYPNLGQGDGYNTRGSQNPSRQEYCSDPYASVHKPKKRMDQHIESPYHEVSGLPEGYGPSGEASGVAGGEDKPSHLSMSYDESLESGYSTPNSRARRVIREIIV